MNLGDFGVREAILALSGVAGVYLLVLVGRLLALNKRRLAQQGDPAARIDGNQTDVDQTTRAADSTSSVESSGGAQSKMMAQAETEPALSPAASSAPITAEPATTEVPPTHTSHATAKHSVVRIYVKSVSVEVPNMARMPKYAVRPDITVDLQINAQPAWENHLECSLQISLHARLNGVTLFLMEIVQCGLFLMHDTDTQLLNSFVRETAQSVLFPYARKHLANLAVDAGFQPVILDPIDFGLLLRNANVSYQRPPQAKTQS